VCTYKGVFKSYRTGHLERELQMVQFSATRCSFIAILWVSLVRFATVTLCVASQRVSVVVVVVVVYFVIDSVRKFWMHTRICVCVCVCVWDRERDMFLYQISQAWLQWFINYLRQTESNTHIPRGRHVVPQSTKIIFFEDLLSHNFRNLHYVNTVSLQHRKFARPPPSNY
jgi:hypothetical protein